MRLILMAIGHTRAREQMRVEMRSGRRQLAKVNTTPASAVTQMLIKFKHPGGRTRPVCRDRCVPARQYKA